MGINQEQIAKNNDTLKKNSSNIKEKMTVNYTNNKFKRGFTTGGFIALIVGFILVATLISLSFSMFGFQDNQKSVNYTSKWLSYQGEVANYIMSMRTINLKYNKFYLSADSQSITYDGKKDKTQNIQNIVTSLLDSELEDYVVQRGELKYVGSDEQMIKIAG